MSYFPETLVDFTNQLITTTALQNAVLFTAVKTGIHRVAVYVEPTTTNALATVTVSVSWTSSGIARSWSSNAMSLGVISNLIQSMFPIRCDAGTPITVTATLTGTAGAFNASFLVKPPQ
jgi:hypothetical protein